MTEVLLAASACFAMSSVLFAIGYAVRSLQYRNVFESIDVQFIEWHRWTLRQGWWDFPLEQRVPLMLDWIEEELKESRTAYAERGLDAWTSIDKDGLTKPEGLRSELVDIMLLCADLLEGIESNIGEEVRTKIAYDKVRRYRRDAVGNLIV